MTSRLLLMAAAALSLTGLPPASATSPFPLQIVVRGELSRDDYERVITHPFAVPPGATRVEISLTHTGSDRRTVLDLGLRGPTGLRGWSGGRETRIHVAALSATPGYIPGPVEPGDWAVLLGVPNIRNGPRETYQLHIVIDDQPVLPTRVIDNAAGWYAGDLHAHSGHSDGRTSSQSGVRVPAPPHRVFERASEAGLDFILLSDHNTASHWLDVDRLQPYFDSLLLLHGREITTYRGHANTVGERAFLPFHPASPRHTPAEILKVIAATGAFVSINHPLLPDDERCMGCGWNDMTEDALASVHGVEVVNGETRAGPQWGWTLWAQLLNRGYRLTAVGGSDDHTPDDLADRSLGTPTTVVWARELSEHAIVEGLKSARVFVLTRGPSGPRVDLNAEVDGHTYPMGSEIPLVSHREILLAAELERADGNDLQWIRNGMVEGSRRLSEGRVEWRTVASPGDWFSIIVRDQGDVVAISNAIYIGRR